MSDKLNFLKFSFEAHKKVEEHREFLKTDMNNRIVACIALISVLGVGLFSEEMISLIIPIFLLLSAIFNYMKFGNSLELMLREAFVEQVLKDNGGDTNNIRNHIEETSEQSKKFFQIGDRRLKISFIFIFSILLIYGIFKIFPLLLYDLGVSYLNYYLEVLF